MDGNTPANVPAAIDLDALFSEDEESGDEFATHRKELEEYNAEFEREWEESGSRDIIRKRIKENALELADNLLNIAFHSRNENTRLKATMFAIQHVTEEEKEGDAMRAVIMKMASQKQEEDSEDIVDAEVVE